MREQMGSGRTSINLLDHMVRLLQAVSKRKCRASTAVAQRVTDTILEVIQGPCVQNQNYLAINTELIEILNRMMRAKPINDCVQDEEDDVQLTVLNIFEGLLEGQSSDSQIYDRILSVIDLSVLQVMIVANGDGSEDMNEVQIEGLVLLQMLCDYKPILKDEVNLPERVRKVMGKDVVSVEVVWNHELQRRFFHVPEIASSLAEATKKHLVANNNRDSQEEKLGDFIRRIYGVQRELQHQKRLKEIDYIELRCPPMKEDGRVLFHIQVRRGLICPDRRARTRPELPSRHHAPLTPSPPLFHPSPPATVLARHALQPSNAGVGDVGLVFYLSLHQHRHACEVS